MMTYTIALFGEAERGAYQTAYFCQTLAQLDEYFGNPPPESRGLYYAIQALLFQRHLIFFRVAEEGYSTDHYLSGLKQLKLRQLIPQVDAICIPGVGDQVIIEAILPVCALYHCILITTESDLYDYLTYSKRS